MLEVGEAIVQAVKSMPEHNTSLLNSLDLIVEAGFRSHRKTLVNCTIAMWNETFGKADSLEYPSGVERAVRRLKDLVDLELPGFPEHPTSSVSVALTIEKEILITLGSDFTSKLL